MKKQPSDYKQVVKELEAKCAQLGVRVIYDELRSEGGVCRVKGAILIIINRRASLPTRIRILSEALKVIELKEKQQPFPVREK